MVRCTFFILLMFVVISACGGGPSSSGNSNTSTTPIGAISDSDSSTNSVYESAGPGSSVGIILSAIDGDTGDIVTYSLVDDADGLFSVNASTGVVAVAKSLDYETASSHTIRARAQSSDGSRSEADFTISVIDETNEPILSFSFPVTDTSTVVHFTGSDIDVAGTANDPFGLPVTVDVKGGGTSVAASIDIDGNWRAENVPVNGNGRASVDLEIEARNSSGGITRSTITISTATMLVRPTSVGIDSVNSRALIVDSSLEALIAVDLRSGDRDILSDDQHGTGTSLKLHGRLAVDPVSNRAFVRTGNFFTEVNLATGDRTILSEPSLDLGPIPLNDLGDLAIDRAGNRLIVGSESALIAVDLTNETRSIVSGVTRGVGPSLGTIGGVVVVNNNQALVTNSTDGLISVDLGSGNRTFISNDSVGTGPSLVGRMSMTFDNKNNRVLITGIGIFPYVIAVDLSTGNRTEISGVAVGNGPEIIRPTGIGWDSQNNQVVIADEDRSRITSVDITTGDRSLLASNNIGDGESLIQTRDINLDWNRSRAIFGRPKSSIIAVDLQSGDRTELFDGTTGTGPGINGMATSVYDSDNDRLLVKQAVGLVSIDLPTGNRAIVSDRYANSGPVAQAAIDMVIDTTTNRIFATEAYVRFNPTILTIDLTTGDRTTLSSNLIGSGTDFMKLDGLILDPALNRLLVPDYVADVLFAVDLTTGDRSIVVDFTASTEGKLANVRRVDLDRDSRRLILANAKPTNPAIYDLDLVTGDWTELSGKKIGQGTAFDSVTDLKLDQQNDRAFVANQDGAELLIVDLTSGDRVLFSK